MPTHLLVGNPTAQSGKNRERIDRALSLFAERGVDVELLPTLPGGATIGAVTRALEERPSVEVVVAMGGDGTFREVAAGLYGSARRTEVALAMLPTGTANDQGKSFGLAATPAALARNVDVVVTGVRAKLDVGVYEALGRTDLFFDSAGWGFTARVLAQRNVDRKVVEGLGPLKEIYRDHAVYAGAFLKTFVESAFTSDLFVAHATLDDRPLVLEGLTDLVVKNTRVYAGSWVFDRTSRPDDGAFELVPFRGKLDWTSKAIVDLDGNPLHEEVLNQVGIEHSKPIRFSRLTLRFDVPAGGPSLAAQLDGEEWPAAPEVTIQVVPRGLDLVVPGS
jgi:diacylglycerol kinase family enzyme